MEKGIPIRSISRAITILQEINQMGSLSMMQIARRGGLPYPTTCRIVQTLIHEGLIEQEPSRKFYRPTALVQSLSQGFRSDSMVVEHGRDHIRRLTREIGWPVSLTVRIGTHMVVRDATHSETSLTFEVYYPGYRLPLVDCAAGRVCMAFSEEEELERIMQWLSLVDETGEASLPTQIALMNRTRIRADGYDAIGWGQHNLTPGRTSSIAVPILLGGRYLASLTLIYFASAMKQDEALSRHLEALRRTAQAIARDLERAQGGEPDGGAARP